MRKGKKRLVELGKDLLILLLIASALLLARQTGALGRLRPAGERQGEQGGTVSSGVTAAATPFAMAVVGETYGRCGLTSGAERVAEMYDRFSAPLGEALGSSGEPEEVSETAWREALAGPSVYFDYLYDQPLSLLSVWLGTEIGGGAASHTARRLCLALEGDALALYYIRARYGEFYRCETALSASSLTTRLSEYSANGAAFAFELSETAGTVDAYTLLEAGMPEYSRVSAVNPLRDPALLASLPLLFEFGSVRSYSEADGTVFVEDDATLRVSSGGTVSYRCKTGALRLGKADMSLQAAVEAARSFCQGGPGASCGAAALGLSSLGYDQENNTYTIGFEYAVDGVPVRLTDGPAVELTISNGALREAVLRYRAYTQEADGILPLPRAQALAAADAMGGGSLTLTYVDTMRAVNLQWLTA